MDFFDRQRRLKGFGSNGQDLLAGATVLIAGMGGLGCPVALYLAASGVRQLILADGDVVDPSNLHRQILFGVQDIGKNKASTAAARLQMMYPYVRVLSVEQHLKSANLRDIIHHANIVIDATDRFDTRYLLNDACYLSGVPLVQGAVSAYEGTCSVFHYPSSEQGFDYRHAFPSPPLAGEIPSCEEEGVLGVLPGVIGTLMATEAIKILSGVGEVLSGKILHYDLRTQQTYHIQLVRSAVQHPASWEELINREANDQLTRNATEATENGRVFIDVREPGEIKSEDRLKGINIPLSSLITRRREWECFPRLIVYCQTGVRSEMAVRKMKALRPDLDIVQLNGGLEACNNT